VYRNSRGDVIRRRVTRQLGGVANVNASTIEVITKDGDHLTPEEYRDKLDREKRARAPASDYRVGGKAVPPP
jgi:hypothetical protein